uniref:Serpentine Receptor, class H n=1 Tax=Panagrellus redivivus TaxID=6233 RepID=A0A7E4V0G1_PANRE
MAAIYSVYWDISLVFTTCLFCFMLHMIITKSSTEMSGYKWYLVHQLTWSYLFDVYVGLWKVIPLWPFYMGYSSGIFANFNGNSATIQLILPAVLSVGMGFSIYLSVLYRYVQASPFSQFYKYYNVTAIRAVFYVVIFFGIEAIICIPIVFTLPQQTDFNTAMTSKCPVLIPIFAMHSSVFGYETTDTVVQYVVLIVFVLVMLSVSIVFLYLNFIRILRKNKQHLSIGTYNMQLMLFRTLFIQIAIFGALLILPITMAFILTLFGMKWMPKFGLIAISILGTHAFVDFCVLSYFIRSYREYVKGCYNKIRQKFGLKVTVAIVTPLGPSTVSELPSRLH